MQILQSFFRSSVNNFEESSFREIFNLEKLEKKILGLGNFYYDESEKNSDIFFGFNKRGLTLILGLDRTRLSLTRINSSLSFRSLLNLLLIFMIDGTLQNLTSILLPTGDVKQLTRVMKNSWRDERLGKTRLLYCLIVQGLVWLAALINHN